jgi:hypothetical protein
MICSPDKLPQIFAETPIPRGAISAEAADAIARLLWEAAENDMQVEQQADAQGQEADA